MKYTRPCRKTGHKPVRKRILYRVKSEAHFRRQRIDNYARCQECGGTGIDEEKLAETFLDLRFYNCPRCQGSGERRDFRQ